MSGCGRCCESCDQLSCTENLRNARRATLRCAGGESFRVHGEHGRVSAGADCVTFKQRLLRRVLQPWIDHYIAVSKDLQAFLREGMRIPALQVSLIYNGVDVQRFHPRDAGRPESVQRGCSRTIRL